MPPVVRAGEKATLRFSIFHPGTGEPIKKFEVVHERQYHLFVISQDMEYFQHIHPAQQPDGTWSIDVTLPKAGYYKILSDFLPGGGAVQFLARPLVTRGYAGDLAADSARLVPDTNLTKTVDDVTATLSYDPAPFIAGLYGHLNFHLTDTATGRPITDLQTYLGAFGHTLIMSEDMVDYVHSHPLDIVVGARRRRASGIPDSAGRRSREAAWRSGRHVRRPGAKGRPLPRLDPVPPQRQGLHVRVHLRGGGGCGVVVK